jgi:hypothetical protein
MASVRVRFSPGFLSGSGFPEKQSHRSWPCGEKSGFPQSILLQHGSRTPPEQSSLYSELPWSSHRGWALRRGAPPELKNHARANNSNVDKIRVCRFRFTNFCYIFRQIWWFIYAFFGKLAFSFSFINPWRTHGGGRKAFHILFLTMYYSRDRKEWEI